MGQAVAKALGARGCHIILAYRNSRQAADQTVDLLRRQGIHAASLRCDLAQPVSIKQAMKAVQRQFKRLDVVVNLASIYERTLLKEKDLAKAWDLQINSNARSAYLLTLAAAPLMKISGTGRVVHVSDWTSASGRPRYKDYSTYFVSKAATKAITETLALELAPEILVNAIAPGPILPPQGLTRQEDTAVREATPLGKWGGAEEIAKAVLFFVETDFVTGETLRVDGGRHLY